MSGKLPALTGAEVIRALERGGFGVVRVRSSHHFLRHPDGRTTVVPAHAGETIGPGLMGKSSVIAASTESNSEAYCSETVISNQPRKLPSQAKYRGGIVLIWEVAMNQQIAFAEALDAAEQLDDDAQAEFVAVLSRRLAERGRERVAAVVAQARREFAAGECQPMTAAEMVREAQ